MATGKSQYLTPDPDATAELARDFGSGAGNAEALIEANDLARSEALREAQLHRADEEAELDLEDVAKAAGIDRADLEAAAVRGPYVVYVAKGVSGRVYKDALVRDDKGKLSVPEEEANPRREAVRAQVEAAEIRREAEAEAERIRAEAEEEAQRKVAEAAQKAEEQAADAQAKAAEKAEKAEKGGSTEKQSSRRTRSRK